jgi:hypothetical protein
VRREQARWRLSAVLLSLVLAFGAAMCHVATADQSDSAAAHRAPSAVMVADLTNTSSSPGKRDGQTRLVANRGHAGVLLFVVALSALLAALRRPHLWSPAASLSWMLPTAVGANPSRGRAPPRLA